MILAEQLLVPNLYETWASLYRLDILAQHNNTSTATETVQMLKSIADSFKDWLDNHQEDKSYNPITATLQFTVLAAEASTTLTEN